MKIVHVFRNGSLEVGTATKFTRPGYRWVNGYSEVLNGGYSNPMTRKNWQAMATRDGFKLKFHETEAEARKAAF